MEGIERNQMDFGGWNMISDIKISFEETNRLDIAGKKNSMLQKNSKKLSKLKHTEKKRMKTILIVPLWLVGQHQI